jgi:phosphatidylglycerophosphate synthase
MASATPDGDMNVAGERRPLQTRNARWAKVLASLLAKSGISPNAISVFSIFFAALACGAFVLSAYCTGLCASLVLVVAAVGIQLRLLCNMLDGMVAVEYGKKSALGGVYNEVPDRIADVLIIVGAGYAILALPYAHEIAWFAAVVAVTTAYVRALGQSLGTPAFFVGPMAKPHRMATLTVAAIGAAAVMTYGWSEHVIYTALIVIALGSLVTCTRRLVLIRRVLIEQAS